MKSHMTREQYEIRKAAERREAFLMAVQPFVRYRADIECMCMPKTTIYADGRIDREYPTWAIEAFAKIDELIAQVASSFNMGARP